MKIRNEKVIDLSEWDDLVVKTYGRPYSFQQQDGCRPRGSHRFTVPDKETADYKNSEIVEQVNGPEMGVSFAAWLARDAKKPIAEREEDYVLELWWHRNFYPDFQMVANDLHARGLLPAGTYALQIDW